MATDRELTNKLSSGEITQIKVGGTASGNILPTTDEAQALVDTLKAAEVTDNANAILDLQARHFKVRTSANASSTTSSVYSQLNALNVPTANLVVGVPYIVTMSMLFSYSTTVRSAFFRFSFDNGVTFTEVRREVKDTTDKIPETLVVEYAPTAGVDADIIIEYRTEADGDVLDVSHQHILFERFD